MYYLCIALFIHCFIYLFIYLCIALFIYLFIYLSNLIFFFFAVDEAKIFVTDTDNKRIYVANVADLQFTELFSEEIEVWDFAFDSVEQKLYWLQKAIGPNEIYKSNVDGTNMTMVFNAGDGSKYDIA